MNEQRYWLTSRQRDKYRDAYKRYFSTFEFSMPETGYCSGTQANEYLNINGCEGRDEGNPFIVHQCI